MHCVCRESETQQVFERKSHGVVPHIGATYGPHVAGPSVLEPPSRLESSPASVVASEVSPDDAPEEAPEGAPDDESMSDASSVAPEAAPLEPEPLFPKGFVGAMS